MILSDTLFAMYEPEEVRESAPITTPPSYSTAIIVVCTVSRNKYSRIEFKTKQRNARKNCKSRTTINVEEKLNGMSSVVKKGRSTRIQLCERQLWCDDIV